MKNIQVVDGANNSIFEVYQVSDGIFEIVFPDGNDVAFIGDVETLLEDEYSNDFWQVLYQNKVNKKEILGIHGTLHLTGSNCLKKYFPSLKEEEVRKDGC